MARLFSLCLVTLAFLGLGIAQAEAQRPPVSTQGAATFQSQSQTESVVYRTSFPALRHIQCQPAGNDLSSASCSASGAPYCPATVLFRAGGRGAYQQCEASCVVQSSAASSSATCRCTFNGGDCAPVTPARQ